MALGLALMLLLVAAPSAAAQVGQPQPPQPPVPDAPPSQTHEPGEPDPPLYLEPEPRVVVGMGENTGSMFGDPLFRATGIRHVRFIVPYDVVRARGRWLAHADSWLQNALGQGLEPLVSFGYSARRRLRWHMPSVREYRKHVLAFRGRYPWVRHFSTWNEANHKRVQPTGKRPVRTAALYRELRGQCEVDGCHVLAADVLLTSAPRTWRWIRKFRRRAGKGPHVWGLHNYPDANRRSQALTRRFLRTAPKDEVWFTETGGIVKFGRRWRRSENRAAKALRYVFRLARVSKRVTRIYLYNWRDVKRNRRWDSGLISSKGRIRKAYWTLLKSLGEERFRPPGPQDRQEELPPSGELPVRPQAR
jgi:hypothetical protein